MEHRFAFLPETPAWLSVRAAVEAKKSLPSIVAATLEAVPTSLGAAATDVGVSMALFYAVEVARAAHQGLASSSLEALKTWDPENLSKIELVSALCQAMDRALLGRHDRTDLSELGQLSMIETLLGELAPTTNSGGLSWPQILAPLRSEKGFASLMHHFVARLTERYLTYFLSRELPLHVGLGLRFRTLPDLQAFNASIATYCVEATEPVRNEAQAWYPAACLGEAPTVEACSAFAKQVLSQVQYALRRTDG